MADVGVAILVRGIHHTVASPFRADRHQQDMGYSSGDIRSETSLSLDPVNGFTLSMMLMAPWITVASMVPS